MIGGESLEISHIKTLKEIDDKLQEIVKTMRDINSEVLGINTYYKEENLKLVLRGLPKELRESYS